MLVVCWIHVAQPHLGKLINSVVENNTGNMNGANIKMMMKNSSQLMTGRYSLAEAYQNQQGWPGRMPWGGIYPPMLEVWKQLPPKTRIWSMHIHSYCMLPDCHVEGYQSFRLSPHMDEILYGDPQTAKKWLKNEKLNFFFVSTGLKIVDPLPLSPLFSPATIAKYFGIVWTDSENALLTWKEEARFPISDEWLKRYREQVEASNVVQTFPFQQVRTAMAALEK